MSGSNLKIQTDLCFTSFLTQPEIEHIPKYVSDTIYVLFSVQQAPICTYRTDKSFLHRRPAGVGRHSSDL